MNIHEDLHKIKVLARAGLSFLDRRDTYSVLIVIFASLSSFLLGWLSHVESARKPVIIENIPQMQTPAVILERINTSEPISKPKSAKRTSGIYVASKSGSKYHLPTCLGAQKIAEANKIWFQSREEAEKAGYTPAGNCPGL